MNINDGTVDARTRGEHLHVRVQDGFIVEQTNRGKDECTTLRYGQERKTRKGNKVVKEEYFQPETLQAIRKGCLWKRQTGISLGGSKGTVECYSTSGGAYGKEVFKYDNGVQAYMASRWRKKLQIRHPNGKQWMVILGKVHLNRSPITERLDPNADDLGLWSVVRGNDWNVTVYDTEGTKVVTQGQVKNRQKQGKWLEHGKETYYISGVKVSRGLYEDNPEKWDAREVLRVPNAQLRCSLLNRIGYDKLLEKIQPRIICQGDDGGQLLEIDSGLKESNNFGLDSIMRLVKVICPSTGQIYVLRVPPGIANYEQARQWTFGLRQQSISEGAQLELVKET